MPSDASTSSARSFVDEARQALAAGDHASISNSDIAEVITAAIKLYVARAELTQELPAPLCDDVTPTEVVVAASEMIRVVDLNPFDLSMWYRRAR